MKPLAIIEWVFSLFGLLICIAGAIQYWALGKRSLKIKKATLPFRNTVHNRQSQEKIEQPALGLLLHDLQDLTMHDLLANPSLYKDVKSFLKEYKNEIVIPTVPPDKPQDSAPPLDASK